LFRADLVSESMEKARLRADISVDAVRRLGIAEDSVVTCRVPKERIRVYPGGTLHS
jgi:hypothetical protein